MYEGYTDMPGIIHGIANKYQAQNFYAPFISNQCVYDPIQNGRKSFCNMEPTITNYSTKS